MSHRSWRAVVGVLWLLLVPVLTSFSVDTLNMADKEEKDDQEQSNNQSHNWIATKAFFNKFMELTDRLFDIENQRVVVGMNSGLVAAFITTSYRSHALTLVPKVVLPPVCGLAAAISWQYLITKKLSTRELECPSCTSIRGLTIAISSAAILPLTIGGLIVARRSKGVFAKAERFTENFSDNLMQRPALVVAVLAQGIAGWIMANREFEKTLVERIFSDSYDS